MRIGIAGSTIDDEDLIHEKVALLGKVIAERGHTVVTGGGDGSPCTAALSARNHGGEVIAFSPARNVTEHVSRFGFPTDAYSELKFIPDDYEHADQRGSCLKLRNVLWVSYSDAIIILRGKTGTLNEFTIAYDLGKNIGVLKGSGGVADALPGIVEMLQKPSGSIIVYSEDPVELIDRLESQTEGSK